MAEKRKIAICGKGGVGKTAFVAMLTKILVDESSTGNLLVVDADPAVGLPSALGIRADKTIALIREKVIDSISGGDPDEEKKLAANLDYMIMESMVETENFSFLAMGRSEGRGCYCSVNDLLHMALGVLVERFDTLLIDGEAGLEQINRQVSDKLDNLIILTDASNRGRETVEHIRNMAVDEKVIQCKKIGVVINHIPAGINRANVIGRVAELGLPIYGAIPEDVAVTDFDLAGRPLLELPDDSPAIVEVKKIVQQLL